MSSRSFVTKRIPRIAASFVFALLPLACRVPFNDANCKRSPAVTHAPVELTNLLAGNANLLVADGWTPLNGEIVGHFKGGVFHCPSAAPGVAEIDKPGDAFEAGWEQTVALNQSVPAVVVASVEVRALGLSRKRLHDFALAIVLRNGDGTVINTSTTCLRPRQSEWHTVSVRIVPPAPVATATVKLVSLSQSGHSEFRAPTLVQLPRKSGLVSVDGFALPDNKQLAPGWWVVDMQDPSAAVPLASAETIDLQAVITDRAASDPTAFSATVKDTSGRDRALTLLYVVPVEGNELRWLAEPRHEGDTASPGEYLVASSTQGGRGQLSQWPFAAVANESAGFGIAMDLDRPAVYRVGYSAGARVLYLAIDLGLAPEHPSANVGGRVFGFDGRWGFRGAMAAYYEHFPESFRSRTPEHGLWIPFAYISGINNWQDFGFRFSEGLQELDFCNKNDMYSLFYMEPLTFWVNMPSDIPRNIENGIDYLRGRAEKGSREAKAFFSSAYHDADGRWAGTGIKAAWCDGIVWSMNSAPGIAGDNHFSTHWNERNRNWVVKAKVHGIYIDSIEGYITDELNYRRDHFAAMETPLTFDVQNRPVIYTGLVTFEYARAIANASHELNIITMANTTPGRFPWLPPMLDVMGTETDWYSGEVWSPPDDDYLIFVRAMAGPKPFCFLMNTDFKVWTYDHSERYMKRCVAYGMYPGFFSADAMTKSYFFDPAMYERDRPLFKKYVPLCKLAGEAGWKPVTNARSSDAEVYVERYGENILTVFNDASEPRQVTITLDGDWPAKCVDRVSGKAVAVTNGKIALTLNSEDVAVLVFEKTPAGATSP